MMPDLSKCFNLSIIGMEIVGPGINDLDVFGFQVFRGFKSNNLPIERNLPEDNLNRVIAKIIQKAGMKFDLVGVVTFQSELKERIDNSEIGIASREISEHKDNLVSAWLAASEWLDSGQIEAALLVDSNLDDQSFSAVLVSTSQYAANNAKQVLGVISGIDESDKENNQSLVGLINSALRSGNLQPDKVGLILASAPLDTAHEIIFPQDLKAAIPYKNSLSCALTGGNSGLVSVIKTAWCLHQRIIPGTSDWKNPKNPQDWVNSAFYIPTESRTWFASNNQPARIALTINAPQGDISSVFLIQEGHSAGERKNTSLQQEHFYLFPVYGSTVSDLLHKLEKLMEALASKPDMRTLSNENLGLLQSGSQQPDDLVACILGHSCDELSREIEFGIRGIPAAVEKNSDWRTPVGSYMTPEPLGKTGLVSFVYPGAFNSYPGAGRDLFYLFPSLYDRLASISSNLSNLLKEKMLYPRSISALSSADLEAAEKRLSDDPLAMLISGSSLAALFTFLLRDIFEIHPASAFGYSLGEISMMFASGAWTRADETSATLRASPLFQTRLAGPQNAIRESWQLPIVNLPDPDDVIFSNFVLMADPETVKMAIKNESRVFMTHINTPRQVVIAGDPTACRNVIETLKCNAIQAPFNYALHCEAMQSEYSGLQSLLSWPVANQPDMTLYSAAAYQAMPIEQSTIASQIAYGLCHQLDFPRLVNQAFIDGARIFIELGAGSNCSRWVDESLKGKPHAAFSINRKGLDDHAAVLQLLAKLISHHVSMNLKTLIS